MLIMLRQHVQKLLLSHLSNTDNISVSLPPLTYKVYTHMVLQQNVCQYHHSTQLLQSEKEKEKDGRFHSILSDENKVRSQGKLNKIDPVRTWNDYLLKPDHKYAAVLVPLCTVKGEPSLLFQLRSSRLKKHRGQVSFPGGIRDKTDTDFIHTALRETHEEIGIEPSTFDIWGQMNPLPGSAGRNVVYPILAKAGEIDIPSLRLNKDEVAEVFSVSLKHLCHPSNSGSTRFRDEGYGEYTLPVYTGAPHRIWGLTAVVIHQALSIVAPDLYKLKVRHVKSLHQRKSKLMKSHKKS